MGLRMSVTMGLGSRQEATIEGLRRRTTELEGLGFDGVWMPTASSFDAITALVAAGAGTSRIGIGTAIVPTFPRHPVAMAQQALTAQAALGGRFTLGIGLSHKVMMEDALGIPYIHPAAHMSEYLSVLAPLLRGEHVSFRGESYRVETELTVAGGTPVPLVVAALGPAMLKLAGRFADGTITSWVGPRTLEQHIVPLIAGAAREAGRTAPRIIAGLPIALAHDIGAARERVATQSAWYNSLPSYRAMFEREGVSGPADLAILGDEKDLEDGLRRLAEAGASEFAAQLVAVEPGSPARTLNYLASRC